MNIGNLLFPQERTVLYVSEVAAKLKVTDQHVIDLIEEGQLNAINVGGGLRKFYRIPVLEYEGFLRRRHSSV
jgi:excisionase family DNA binding protein